VAEAPALRHPRLRWRKAAVGAATLVALGAPLAPATTGCYGRECDGDFQYYGGGSLVDPDTFQTTPMNAKWLKHSHRRLWMIDTSVLGEREIDWYVAYVSPGEEPTRVPPPNVEPDNFTIASGNAAIVKLLRGDACRPPPNWEPDPRIKSCFFVQNDTCADFYLRVVVHAKPLPPAADAGSDAAADAGSDAAADARDGATDGSADAPADAITE
jgi:hypothetical protein